MFWVLPFLRSILERVRVPVVYTVHCLLRAAFGIGREPAHILEYSGQQKTTIGLARRVIALTHDEAALTSGYYPEARERIRVVGNGIDDSQTARHAARRKKSDESLLALYAGRLVERKGSATCWMRYRWYLIARRHALCICGRPRKFQC